MNKSPIRSGVPPLRTAATNSRSVGSILSIAPFIPLDRPTAHFFGENSADWEGGREADEMRNRIALRLIWIRRKETALAGFT